jgi:hypothetical protein
VPDVPTPEDLGTYLKDIERRVRILETAPRAEDTTQPWSYNFVDVAESTVSTSYANLATVGPTVTMDTTNTARILVTGSVYISSPSNTTGEVGFYVDGILFADLLANSNSGPANLAINVTNVRAIIDTTNLRAGSHTFQLRYRTTGTAVQFAARFLMIQPF